MEANKDRYNYITEEAVSFIQKYENKYAIEDMMVSFSGGKDSTVTSHLVNRALGTNKVLHVFGDTTLEFPYTLEYKKRFNKNEESQETTKVSYSNEYFEVIVPESWEGEWTVTEEDNTMNGIKSTLYRFSHDPADGEEGGAADVYVLDMSDTSRPLSHYSRMLPSAGCEEVGLTSFGYNDVFKMEVANGFFYENGATITLK